MDRGKSTMGKIIAGLEKPSKGQVFIDDINTNDKKMFLQIRKKIGVIFQNPENQILFNNVFDDIAFMMKNLEIVNYESKIINSLKELKMENFIRSEAYNLSLGQKQRINIAGVYATKPKYIVLDEPTSMIDPQGKEDIYKIINNLKVQGYTIIYITNLIDEILMSDRVIVLENGQIIKIFNKNDILNNIEFLKEHEMKIPEIVDLVYQLKNKGVNIDVKHWTKEEILQNILQLF